MGLSHHSPTPLGFWPASHGPGTAVRSCHGALREHGVERLSSLAQGLPLSCSNGRPSGFAIFTRLADPFHCQICTAVEFRKMCLRNEPAAKMDDGLPAVFFDWRNDGGISTAMRATKLAFEVPGRQPPVGRGSGWPRTGAVEPGCRVPHGHTFRGAG
jgi:hypothetical protein